MSKKNYLAILAMSIALGACSTTGPGASGADPVAKRQAIDANVDGAMTKLYAQAPGSRELVRRARGVLVFPSVLSAGLVVGASYGQGALLVGGRPDSYYSTTGGSVGLLAGADSRAVYILFMTDDALAKFRNSSGWTAGVDAAVSVVKLGADVGVDTQTAQQPVIGYVLTNAGLMANISIDGTKTVRIQP